MANLLDKLSKEVPAGRGVSQLTQSDIKQIGQARGLGYSWEQIHKAIEKYNSPQALAGAYYREIETTENGKV